MEECQTIMLIDDDPDDRQLFYEALSEVDASCKFIPATSSESAIEMLKEKQATPPDFIFLDLNMPAKDGWHCLEELRKINNLEALPVIIYTTSSINETIDFIPKQGNLFFISKPSKFFQIKEAIRLVLEYRWQEVENLNGKLFPLGKSAYKPKT